MGCGRLQSSYELFPTCVCILLMLTVTDARPNRRYLSSLVNEDVGSWKPMTDNDKWRAFEPEKKETSQTEWWKEKLDDDLWNPKAYEDSTNTLENAQPTNSNPVSATTIKPVSDSEEFCRVDYECRAGRTCILGVCKCYTAAMCGGHHKPICGSDGVQYASHCELHRTACINRVHIRPDRRGRCFQKEIEEHEKSWLMEQERLLQEEKKKVQSEAKNSVDIPAQSLVQFPQDINKGPDDAADAVHDAASTVDEHVPVVTEKTTTTETVEQTSQVCTWKDMSKFKDDLLMFYCQKFVEPNCKEEVKTDREYLSMMIFSYCDKDYDYYLTADELDDKEKDENFTNNIIVNCHLRDFIKFADNLEIDNKLTVSEFTSAFEPPIPAVPPHAKVEVISTLASAGNGLELKCGIDAEKVVWRRHGAQLTDDKRSHKLMVFDDGALFFSTVGLHHIGNYTCMDASDESNAQIHRLKVQTLPVVEVSPVTQTHRTGLDIELKCHAEGVPVPVVTWLQGGKPLEYTLHITHYFGGGHIVIHNAQFDSDAGTYTCSAHNQAGTVDKSVSVSVLPPSAPSSKESVKETGTFVVYNSKGISAYDPMSCLLKHQVFGDFGNFKFIPDALDGPLTLCRKEEDCQWGGAVKVGSEFIYVSQTNQNRVVVMDAVDTLNPLQVIDTDKRPLRLWYVKHLDQVWVLCGNLEQGEGNKTIVVIRDASQHIQHRSVHTQPVGNHFDMVQDLFIAPSNDLNHEFEFGYVSHLGQSGLFKINLEDMSYTKTIDLTNYGCIPTNIAFVPIGGHVIIQCVSAADQHTLQLTMDYLTDTITSATSHTGRPMASPDSRHLVTVDMLTGKVIVSSVSDEGVLETTYDVTVSTSISDATFVTAVFHHGYDLVMTSDDGDDVITMNLVSGKVEKLKGSNYSVKSNSWNPSSVSRHIVTGNSMSNYLMTPSKTSLVILDTRFKQVECEFLDSVGSDVMIYIPSIYTS
uniref:Kazal-like domain-containing protein n=1 Tax=Arion vulgaris TaxID=1028688 RepID=A0A0B7A5X0_9EUPU